MRAPTDLQRCIQLVKQIAATIAVGGPAGHLFQELRSLEQRLTAIQVQKLRRYVGTTQT